MNQGVARINYCIGEIMSKEKSRKQLEEEERRRAEANERAFEAWVEKKREEQKKRKQDALKREKEQLEIMCRRAQVGDQAFQRWMSKRRLKDEQELKQRREQRELRRLNEIQKEKRRQLAKESFVSWLQKKEIDCEPISEPSNLYAQKRAPTPPLPGYCSVWSCDPAMADTVLRRVPRSRSLSLTETLNFTPPQPIDLAITI